MRLLQRENETAWYIAEEGDSTEPQTRAKLQHITNSRSTTGSENYLERPTCTSEDVQLRRNIYTERKKGKHE
jgi:hypothetical protein